MRNQFPATQSLLQSIIWSIIKWPVFPWCFPGHGQHYKPVKAIHRLVTLFYILHKSLLFIAQWVAVLPSPHREICWQYPRHSLLQRILSGRWNKNVKNKEKDKIGYKISPQHTFLGLSPKIQDKWSLWSINWYPSTKFKFCMLLGH